MNRRLILLVFVCFIAISSRAQETPHTPITPEFVIKKGLSDNQLLDLVQKQTFRYFWDLAHAVSGMARERSNVPGPNYGENIVTSGGTGFGIMATIVAADRKFVPRAEAAAHTLKIINFLLKAERFHGAYSHWLNGATGKAIPFSKKDNGADLVETSYLFQGLITAQQYYKANNTTEKAIQTKIQTLWDGVEWDWFTHGQNVLYWHWSSDYNWEMNMPIHGWNECLITYVMAASSSKHGINKEVYTEGWTNSNTFLNGKTYYNSKLPLGPDYGGSLFWSQYSFMGLDPRGLKDEHADYWKQVTAHTLINRQYCIENPLNYKGYGENCWGLTASDSWHGYAGHSPTEDLGVITPTAALSAFPYTPKYSMQALRHFYEDLGPKIWGQYGFIDAFSEQHDWYAISDLAIDEGPIIVMIENYRSGLLWKLFMSHPDVKQGLSKLGFSTLTLK